MRPDESAALIAMLVTAFPEHAITTNTLDLYAMLLSDADVEHAMKAVATWCLREKRFPRIAELREQIERVQGVAPPDIDIAWAEVMKAARSGRLPACGWSHKAIGLAVQAVGFDDIRRSEKPGVERSHFAKAYESAALRTRDAAASALALDVMPTMRTLIGVPAARSALASKGESQPQLKGRVKK